MKKKEHIVRYTAEEIAKLPDRTDWARVCTMKDEDIDMSDIPGLDSGYWDLTSLKKVISKKQTVTLRLKPDAIAWYKAQGKGHISMMQAILERFVEAQK